jgi:hypothetical protein
VKYRKKPVVIEAVQWTGSNPAQMLDFRVPYHKDPSAPGSIFIKTLEGAHRADPGDWIIKGVKDEYYPCKPDIFAATYDPAP